MGSEGVTVREDCGSLGEWLEVLFLEEQSSQRLRSRGDRLCGDHHVWFDTVTIAGKHLTRAAKAGNGLVCHKDHVVLIANLSNPLEVARVSGETATGILDWFHVEGGNGVWPLHQDCFLDAVSCPKAKLLFGFEQVLGAVPVGVWNANG